MVSVCCIYILRMHAFVCMCVATAFAEPAAQIASWRLKLGPPPLISPKAAYPAYRGYPLACQA